MACIRFRRGRWGVDWRDAAGRRRWKTASSELEATELLEAIVAERRRGAGTARITLERYFELFLAEARLRCRPQTVARYEQEFRLHVLPELRQRPLGGISRFELKRLIIREHERGASVELLAAVVSMVFGTAYEDGVIQVNPAHRLTRGLRPRERETVVKAFTSEELGRFLEATGAEALYAPVFRTMAYTGLRPGEARALQARDLELGELRITVSRTFTGDALNGELTKSGRSRRVEIPETLASELEPLARWRRSTEWLFQRRGEFLRARVLQQACKRALRRAGLPEHHSPHSLRHTYASLLLQQGARAEYVQRQLGHASIKLTVDLYGRWLELRAPSELEKLVRRVTTKAVTAEDDDSEPRCKVLAFKPLPRTAGERRRRIRKPNPDEETP